MLRACTGLPTRLEKEMKELYLTRVLKGDKERLKKFPLRIEDPPRRKHMVFLGGSVLADIMKDKPEFWISKVSVSASLSLDRRGGFFFSPSFIIVHLCLMRACVRRPSGPRRARAFCSRSDLAFERPRRSVRFFARQLGGNEGRKEKWEKKGKNEEGKRVIETKSARSLRK